MLEDLKKAFERLREALEIGAMSGRNALTAIYHKYRNHSSTDDSPQEITAEQRNRINAALAELAELEKRMRAQAEPEVGSGEIAVAYRMWLDQFGPKLATKREQVFCKAAFDSGWEARDIASSAPTSPAQVADRRIVEGMLPIETAPMDGRTVILIADMGGQEFLIGYGRFSGQPGGPLSGWITQRPGLNGESPTHWLPLRIIASAAATPQAASAEPIGHFRPTPFGWEDCAEADEGTIALYERPIPQPAAPEGYVLARQTAVEMPNGKKELGYTLLDGVGVFTSREDVYDAIKELSLPLGWVCMTTDQLLPGVMLSAAPTPPATVNDYLTVAAPNLRQDAAIDAEEDLHG